MKTKSFPVLFNSESQVNLLCLNYFLDLVQYSSISSLKTYAKHLLDFYSQFELETEYESIDMIDDEYLAAYKQSLLSRIDYENTENYVSQIMRSVLKYLKWLEDNNYVKNLIGDSAKYRIRIRLVKNGIRHHLIKKESKNKNISIAPRSEWIDVIKKYGPSCRRVRFRFELMIDWCKSAGLRTFEVCALSIDQLPTRATVIKAIENKKNVYMTLNVTKGGKSKEIPINPLLIKKTWDYIELSRHELVENLIKRANQKYEKYKDDRLIFLSEKTGRAILSTSFSNSIRQAYTSAVEAGDLTKDERVWAHGLRHNFVTNLLIGLDRNNIPRVESVARQSTRHGSIDAMEPYLTSRFNDTFE
ncbi:tyrosine-type recombinase/integrase [Marinicella pacifica]|uniref:tyrosine-type recombinase/integrase n=1 Tax=Marinicella pacifica TaxID=1171543 RepID=UPI00166A6685|nr:tyrosine-type recombinase/integrase [Marinicella pacifica]